MTWTVSWPLLFIFQVPQVQLVPPLEKINFNTKPYSSYLACVPEMLLLLDINHILYRRDTYTCAMTITIFLAISQNSSIRQNSVHIFRPDETHEGLDQNNFSSGLFLLLHNGDFFTQTFQDFSGFFTHNTHIRINNLSCPAFFPTFQETRQRKNSIADSPTHRVDFRLRIFPRIRSQNQNSSKASIRDLCWPGLCELCWPLLFIFRSIFDQEYLHEFEAKIETAQKLL